MDSDTTKLSCHQFPETLTGFQLTYILRCVGFQEIASEWWESAFVLVHIGSSIVVSQKLEVIVSSGRRGSSILFACASHNPHSKTFLHRLFCWMCVLDHMHRVGQIRYTQLVVYTVRVGWHRSVLYQDFFRVSGRSLHWWCYIEWIVISRINICRFSAMFLRIVFNFEYEFICWVGSTDVVFCPLFHHVNLFNSEDWQDTVIRVVPYVSVSIQWSCLTT